MPSATEMMKASEKREARRKARQANADKAQIEAQELAAKSEQQAEARRSADAESVKPAAKPKPTAATRKAAARKAAEEQAEKDVRQTAEAPDIKTYLARGETPPLHVLNALAKNADAGVRDEARVVANAAGKAAFDQLVGRRSPRGDVHTRHKRVRTAVDMARETEKARAATGSETSTEKA